MERRRIIFQGRVQGVGFRYTAQRVARGRSVTGWVRNETDGSVLLEVQGRHDSVEDYLEALRRRMGGNIRSERAEPAPVLPGEQAFDVRT